MLVRDASSFNAAASIMMRVKVIMMKNPAIAEMFNYHYLQNIYRSPTFSADMGVFRSETATEAPQHGDGGGG